MALNRYIIKSSMVGALGGFLFGFDTAVIAGTTHALTRMFHLSPTQLGITVSMAVWGAVLGALTSGVLGERMGGRQALRIMALLYVISASWMRLRVELAVSTCIPLPRGYRRGWLICSWPRLHRGIGSC
jgi:predicted MFS family arabinose efflux permease